MLEKASILKRLHERPVKASLNSARVAGQANGPNPAQVTGNRQASVEPAERTSPAVIAELSTQNASPAANSAVVNRSRPEVSEAVEQKQAAMAQRRAGFYQQVQQVAARAGYVGLQEADISQALRSGSSLLVDYKA